MEKCRFGANRRVLHYVLKRERAVLEKKVGFSLEICVIERGGRAARCMGSVLVAHLLASEARRSPATVGRQWGVRSASNDPTYSLVAGDRSGGHAGVWTTPSNDLL